MCGIASALEWMLGSLFRGYWITSSLSTKISHETSGNNENHFGDCRVFFRGLQYSSICPHPSPETHKALGPELRSSSALSVQRSIRQQAGLVRAGEIFHSGLCLRHRG